MNEEQRKAVFRDNPMIKGFLSTALQDLALTENEDAYVEGREMRGDGGTIYDCPVATFELARRECEAFRKAVMAGAAGREALESLQRFTWEHAIIEHIGSDLYLERAGHGAGFCDRDIWSDDRDENRAIGEALSAAVNPRGTLEIYMSDDGSAYFVGGEV